MSKSEVINPPTPQDETPIVYEKYTIKEGDSLVKLAYLFNTSVYSIQQINNLVSDHIFPGLVINIINNSSTYT